MDTDFLVKHRISPESTFAWTMHTSNLPNDVKDTCFHGRLAIFGCLCVSHCFKALCSFADAYSIDRFQFWYPPIDMDYNMLHVKFEDGLSISYSRNGTTRYKISQWKSRQVSKSQTLSNSAQVAFSYEELTHRVTGAYQRLHGDPSLWKSVKVMGMGSNRLYWLSANIVKLLIQVMRWKYRTFDGRINLV